MVARSYHDTVFSGKLRWAVRRSTNREGRGCLLLDDQCTKTGLPVAEVIREKHPYMCVPPEENPMCKTFEKYGEVPEMVPLEFAEDNVTWIASELSSVAGALGAEAIELRNWLLHFGCVSEELRVIVFRLTDWMATPPPPWAAYCALMACCLVAFDKIPGVRPMGIG